MTEFEIIEIPKSHLEINESYLPYYKFINKAYDRVKFKFNVLTNTRVKTPHSFLHDFRITDYGYTLFILLGPKTMPNRTFDASTDYHSACDCDVDIVFDPTKVVWKKVDINTYDLSRDLYRVLGSAGYIHMTDSTVELTTFTSFAKRVGIELLDLTIPKLPPSVKFIEAYCIREHELVEYYTKYCKFVTTGKDDIVFKLSDDNKRAVEFGLKQDIRLAILHRQV